mgnify:CR=1 FL=1
MSRGISPVVGTVLVVAITVTLAAVLAAGVTGLGTPDPTPTAAFSASADAEADRVTVTHEGGDAVVPATLSVEITVDGEPLATQPPVPFFAAAGFRSGPTGPFNSATDDPWTAGETAGLRLASTNSPLLDPGDTVEVTLTYDRGTLATVEASA